MPRKNNWRNFDDDELWLHIVTQVMVVGGLRSFDERFKTSKELRRRISYQTLKRMPADKRPRAINDVLRQAKIRYASKNLKKCRKTGALESNFRVVEQEGGPKAFLKRVSRIRSDRDKIAFVTRNLAYIKSKGARDFLMECGVVEDAIAFDTRVTKVLEKLGLQIDRQVRTNEKIYFEEEQRILSKVCKPLGMKGVGLDRLLHQNYKEIMKQLGANTSLHPTPQTARRG